MTVFFLSFLFQSKCRCSKILSFMRHVSQRHYSHHLMYISAEELLSVSQTPSKQQLLSSSFSLAYSLSLSLHKVSATPPSPRHPGASRSPLCCAADRVFPHSYTHSSCSHTLSCHMLCLNCTRIHQGNNREVSSVLSLKYYVEGFHCYFF